MDHSYFNAYDGLHINVSGNKNEMDDISDMFASMGSFSQAFGMDKMNFGTLIGFYSVECGNVLGLGGAFFAALIAISALAKEEKEHTAEFLLTHPVSRVSIVTDKIVAILLQISMLNAIVYLAAILSIVSIGEDIPWKELSLIHLAYYIMQLEIAGICFGISAFIRKGSLGIGLGFAILMYFFNLMSNMSKQAEFLEYITPFAYTEGSDIVLNTSLDVKLVSIGIIYGAVGIMAAYVKYRKKDIS